VATAPLDIRRLSPDRIEEAKRLICAVCHEYFGSGETSPEAVERVFQSYEERGTLKDLDALDAVYFSAGGEFLVLMDGGRVVGTGAVRRLDDETCELKRLWFLPEYRGLGLGRQMVDRLVQFAREAGYSRMRLDTSARCDAALRLFRKLSFHEIDRYNEGPNDVFMERVL
jgi:putative acetyltransferase